MREKWRKNIFESAHKPPPNLRGLFVSIKRREESGCVS